MVEYIDRDKALDALQGRIKLSDECLPFFKEYLQGVNDRIKVIPSADVVERKVFAQVYWERDTALHQLAEIGKGLGEKMDDVAGRKSGEWLEMDSCMSVCSECGGLGCGSRFCPNCGAKMKGGGEW